MENKVRVGKGSRIDLTDWYFGDVTEELFAYPLQPSIRAKVLRDIGKTIETELHGKGSGGEPGRCYLWFHRKPVVEVSLPLNAALDFSLEFDLAALIEVYADLHDGAADQLSKMAKFLRRQADALDALAIPADGEAV